MSSLSQSRHQTRHVQFEFESNYRISEQFPKQVSDNFQNKFQITQHFQTTSKTNFSVLHTIRKLIVWVRSPRPRGNTSWADLLIPPFRAFPNPQGGGGSLVRQTSLSQIGHQGGHGSFRSSACPPSGLPDRPSPSRSWASPLFRFRLSPSGLPPFGLIGWWGMTKRIECV